MKMRLAPMSKSLNCQEILYQIMESLYHMFEFEFWFDLTLNQKPASIVAGSQLHIALHCILH